MRIGGTGGWSMAGHCQERETELSYPMCLGGVVYFK